MAYDFIFWDNDGVLVDTEGLYYQASCEALSQLDFDLTEEQFAAISLSSGRSVFELATADQNIMEELRHWRNARYSELLSGRELVLPDIRDTLAKLALTVKMAVVTSSRRDHFEIIHARSGLLPFFDFTLCREDYREAKPAPESYLLALQRSGCDPKACLVIEDSLRGLAAAKAAGLTCWVIPSSQTRNQDFSSSDRILESVAELGRLLA